jgi:hypothetical protein
MGAPTARGLRFSQTVGGKMPVRPARMVLPPARDSERNSVSGVCRELKAPKFLAWAYRSPPNSGPTQSYPWSDNTNVTGSQRWPFRSLLSRRSRGLVVKGRKQSGRHSVNRLISAAQVFTHWVLHWSPN